MSQMRKLLEKGRGPECGHSGSKGREAFGCATERGFDSLFVADLF